MNTAQAEIGVTPARARARWGDAFSSINPTKTRPAQPRPTIDPTSGTVSYADVLRAYRAFTDTEYRPPLWAFV